MTNTPVRDLARRFDLDSAALEYHVTQAPYAKNYHWPKATGTPGERATLYALIRMIEPEWVVECGTNWGCSATQILSALQANQYGSLTSIDIRARTEGHPVGKLIPGSLRTRWSFVHDDAVSWLAQSDRPIPFLFEDTDHTEETTAGIYSAALQRLAPGGWIVSHDAYIPAVIAGIRRAGIEPAIYFFESKGRGLAIWRNV